MLPASSPWIDVSSWNENKKNRLEWQRINYVSDVITSWCVLANRSYSASLLYLIVKFSRCTNTESRNLTWAGVVDDDEVNASSSGSKVTTSMLSSLRYRLKFMWWYSFHCSKDFLRQKEFVKFVTTFVNFSWNCLTFLIIFKWQQTKISNLLSIIL